MAKPDHRFVPGPVGRPTHRRHGWGFLLDALGLCLLQLATPPAQAQLAVYAWPPEATSSDQYRVFLGVGAEPEREVQVLMSVARPQGDYRAAELAGRTFSFVPVSYGAAAGPLRVRVVKTFGNAASAVSVHPRS